MKISHKIALCLALGFLAPLSGQNFSGPAPSGGKDSGFTSEISRVTPHDVVKAQGQLPTPPAAYSTLDTDSMGLRQPQTQLVNQIVDFSVLSKRSAFRTVAMGKSLSTSALPPSAVQEDLAVISATYRETGTPEADCRSVALSVGQKIKLDPAQTLQLIEAELQTNSGCACEIVKAAIAASDADELLVVAIVETVINTTPENMKIASQCAIAAMPESLAGVQALLAKYDTNTGDEGSSSKDAKSAKSAKSSKEAKDVIPDSVASMLSPLDFPSGPGGPGGPGGPAPPDPGPIPVPPAPPPVIIAPVSPTAP